MTDSPSPAAAPVVIRPRPLSPHLQIYRLPLSALMSISHRLTGVALSFGMILICGWLWAVAFRPERAQWLHNLLTSPYGQGFLLLWMLAFYYHLCSGVRHLLWDTGTGLEKAVFHKTNYLVIAMAFLLAGLTWAFAPINLSPPPLSHMPSLTGSVTP